MPPRLDRKRHRPVTALILGAAVWPDGPSPTLRRRTLEAARLWQRGDVDQLIACGGLGRYPPTEAATMRTVLTEAGVPDAVIHLEDRSTSTLENIRFALPILKRLGSDQVVIVTDRAHLPRALMVARRSGLTARGAAPKSGARPSQQLRLALRELPAYGVYLWRLRGGR